MAARTQCAAGARIWPGAASVAEGAGDRADGLWTVRSSLRSRAACGRARRAGGATLDDARCGLCRHFQWDGPTLGFRHALAQAAITRALPAETLQRLHAAILGELERTTSGPEGYAALVLHADGAGDDAAVLRYAPLAAARAAALSAHRASPALYAKALGRPRPEPTARHAQRSQGHADQ